MALASGNYVGWERSWADVGDLAAFSGYAGGQTYREIKATLSTKPFSEADLIQAIDIYVKRHGRSDLPPGLDLAIARWVKSIRPVSDADRLIELRIALDGLYARREHATKQDVALRGAWHVCDNRKAARALR